MTHNTRYYTVLLIGVLLALFLALAGGAAAEPAAPAGMTGKIVFSRGPGEFRGNIYVMNADGSNQTRLTTNSADEREPKWSPDGMKIAFTRNWRIFVMDADGNNVTQLTYSWSNTPCWSPDGTKIAFNSPSGLFMMNSDGSDQRQLTTDYGYECSWSPDGTKIAYEQSGDIMVMEVDSGNITNLTNNPSADSSPDWSPDGTRLVYVRWLHRPASSEIFVINSDGTGRIRLTFHDGADVEPAWSPDGTNIVYASKQSDLSEYSDTAISVMDADGGNKISLTSLPVWDSYPDWQVVPEGEGPAIFMPTDDTYVVEAQSNPDTTFGRKTFLQARNSRSDIHAFLKFRVSSLDGVEEARLRLFVKDPGPLASVHAVSPYFLNSDTYWTEQDLKWSNAPLLAGAPLAQFNPTKKGKWVEIDVTGAVRAAITDGSDYVSFAITNSSTNLIAFTSKDDVRRPPELVVITN